MEAYVVHDEDLSNCPACGQAIDYCPGHGPIGDPAGWAILHAHDEGIHLDCAPGADCLADSA